MSTLNLADEIFDNFSRFLVLHLRDYSRRMKTRAYWTLSVNDYHAFDDAIEHYRAAGLAGVKFQEVGCSGSFYHAVFWIEKKPLEYIKKVKKEAGLT